MCNMWNAIFAIAAFEESRKDTQWRKAVRLRSMYFINYTELIKYMTNLLFFLCRYVIKDLLVMRHYGIIDAFILEKNHISMHMIILSEYPLYS